MDNRTRSEISRRKAIEAALVILERDGIGGLTFDSLSRESGISKGGLLHQFRNRHGVLHALLEHQERQFEQIAADYLAKEGQSKKEPNLAAEIAIYREAIDQPNSVARAALAALVDSPSLLENRTSTATARMQALSDEAADLDLSLLRYFAASGIAFHSLLGLTPLDEKMRNRLFDRLQDEQSWRGFQSELASKRNNRK
ncbi:TetR family transcriptional regulator [Burkholderia ubonensis]|uniref:TetR/AcrR family transcriptional regulator n=1 Tax=Burkholderia ubonensis TaxID=101571 RepID=UPI0005EFE9AD|nr:TetR/AcrR family transcriptional regulator [Burkholderia ubonensis]KVD05674.1 TetR family transcriptional regulator [Burkholderia ubonensis]KVD56797.1 TetR family transcriptional regulator [Burkholderia ubonensis]KVD73002.1 TetR family transcriptional regulator [Burkholderia ubonensis]KVU13466.1 TetR family transcriptional regulator [Burkholderia ubonensis]KWF13193.1 TetR family transcriptional regulator [Burkholderia ubonensis]